MGKRLGQHFLKDKKALKKIVAALELKSSDVVVEIGPGHGELTKFLLQANPKKIIAIEKDLTLATKIQAQVASSKSSMVQIIEGDALKVLPLLDTKYDIQNTKYKLVGNIPYYITGYLLRIIGELERKPKLIILTLQKEVAERLTGKMNILAASVGFWGKPEIIGYISKKSFRPQPKVDSAIIKIVAKSRRSLKNSDEIYYGLIRILFKQPRKTILNNLSDGLGIAKKEVEEELERLGFEPKSRGESLTLAKITELTASPLLKRAIIKRKT
ncbi:MAG: ribosomal RNA small subunit methyltransferase A [Candidatus Colwellbacteria bacterium]|nr:ribosomal RNA small subunit methyltransferase A [Candidatus Colwellbacteria bacterium]